MRAIILGSGPSARGFVKPSDVYVIAVNGAIEECPEADGFFTLDHAPENMRRIDELPSWVDGFVAFPDNIKTPDHINRYRRIYRDTAIFHEPSEKGSPEWWLWRWGCVPGLSEKHDAIHTGNSAYGALGVLYHLGYRDVAIVGVDGTQDQKPNGTYPKNLSHLGLLFASALPQIKITSCGLLKTVPQKPLTEWLSE